MLWWASSTVKYFLLSSSWSGVFVISCKSVYLNCYNVFLIYYSLLFMFVSKLLNKKNNSRGQSPRENMLCLSWTSLMLKDVTLIARTHPPIFTKDGLLLIIINHSTSMIKSWNKWWKTNGKITWIVVKAVDGFILHGFSHSSACNV